MDQGQLVEIGSFLPPCGFWGAELGYQGLSQLAGHFSDF